MERVTTLAELLLRDPEILAWLEVNPNHRHERALFEPGSGRPATTWTASASTPEEKAEAPTAR